MLNRPKIDIVVINWPSSALRVEYLQRTLQKLSEYLIVSDAYEVARILSIQQDCESDTFVRQAIDLADLFGMSVWVQDKVSGMSEHTNSVMRRSSSDYLFMPLDDRELTCRLDLSSGLSVLEEYPEIAAISYAMTDGADKSTSYGGRIREFGILSYTSPIYLADTQLLIPNTFVPRFGYFIGGEPHGVGERDMNERMRRSRATVLMGTDKYFDHIGIEGMSSDASH